MIWRQLERQRERFQNPTYDLSRWLKITKYLSSRRHRYGYYLKGRIRDYSSVRYRGLERAARKRYGTQWRDLTSAEVLELLKAYRTERLAGLDALEKTKSL